MAKKTAPAKKFVPLMKSAKHGKRGIGKPTSKRK